MAHDLEEQIRAIVSEVAELEPDQITPEGTLQDFGIDSLTNIEIAVHIEERYGIQFKEEELTEVRTFGRLVALTRQKLGDGG